MQQQIKHHSITVVATIVVLAALAGFFVYSGLYNIAADDPHTKPVFTVMQTLRDRSIEIRANSLAVPNLDDPQTILKGAGQYAAMCTGCHLAPGNKDSEIRPGLYPKPPDLSQTRVEPKAAFWVIKHGIKMSAMPAWGGSHDDETIWSMVAFLQKLPDMKPDQYKELVAKAPPDDDMPMSDGHNHVHKHSGSDGASHDHAGSSDSDDGHSHKKHE
jgi:mono/diheme cytochrome c family protein